MLQTKFVAIFYLMFLNQTVFLYSVTTKKIINFITQTKIRYF